MSLLKIAALALFSGYHLAQLPVEAVSAEEQNHLAEVRQYVEAIAKSHNKECDMEAIMAEIEETTRPMCCGELIQPFLFDVADDVLYRHFGITTQRRAENNNLSLS